MTDSSVTLCSALTMWSSKPRNMWLPYFFPQALCMCAFVLGDRQSTRKNRRFQVEGLLFFGRLISSSFLCCLQQLKDLFTRVAALCVSSVSNVLCNKKKKMPTCTLSVLRALLESLMLLSQTELISTTAPSSMLRRWSTSSSAPYPAGGFHFFVDLSLSYFFQALWFFL